MVGRWLLTMLFLLAYSVAQTVVATSAVIPTTSSTTTTDHTSHDSWLLLFQRRRHRVLQGFGVGAVIETPPPTVSPTATVPVTPNDDWTASSMTVHYKVYTGTDEAQSAVQDKIETLWMETLQNSAEQQSLAISLERFVTRSLGPCEVATVSPFPDFAVCQVVATTVRTLSDVTLRDTALSSLLPPTLFVDALIPMFNNNNQQEQQQQAAEGRVEWHDPVAVTSTLTFRLQGVDVVMNDLESAFFANQLWSLLDDSLWDDSIAFHQTQHVPLVLEQVLIVNQTSSSGDVSGVSDTGETTTNNSSDSTKSFGTGSFRRALQQSVTVGSDTDVWNQVQVSLSATCAYATTCAPDTLRQAVSASEHTYGDLLMITLPMGNNANELVFFDKLTNITIVAPPSVQPVETDGVVPTIAPSPPATTTAPGRKRRIPQWFWVLILICISFIVASLLYVCIRQTIRAMEDDSEHPDEYRKRDNRHDRPNSNESVDFSASLAPTLSQVKNFEPREQYPQHAASHSPQQQQQRGVFSFGHKKDNQNNHKKSVQEMEDEDYDNRSYDDGEFSVHPHDFQHNQEDDFDEEQQQQDDYYDDGYDSREDDSRRYQEEERRHVRDEDRRHRGGDRNRGNDHRRRGGGGGGNGRDEKRRGGRKR